MIGSVPQPSSAQGHRRLRWVGFVAGLLALHFALAVGSKLHESTTADELGHLAGGFTAWRQHDYRLHPETGIFPQLWAALPWALSDAPFPVLEGNAAWDRADAGVFDYQLFYESGSDHFRWLMAGRVMIALFSVATGLLVFCWSRRLFGNAGGAVSLVFFAFCPTFLAHGALVTTDVCMTFFFLAAAGAWWRHLHDGRFLVWALSALVCGLAFVTKFSALLLLPMIGLMGIVRVLAPEPLALLGRVHVTRGSKAVATLLSALGHGLVAMLMIWAFFGFRYALLKTAPGSVLTAETAISGLPAGFGFTGGVVQAAKTVHLLPEAYLQGLSFMLGTIQSRGAFLHGDYSQTGWPTFFLWTFGVKSTVALLVACALVAFLALRRWRWDGFACFRSDCYRITPLLVLPAIYGYSAVTGHLNIGHRHILPIYPALFIGVGVLGATLYKTGARAPAVLLSALLGWHVVSAVRSAPHFIAYFNELAGGPENGRHLLTDSSIDWGQDLPGLKDWIEAQPSRDPVYLAYFGGGEPAYYGLNVRRLPFLNNFNLPPVFEKLEPGFYSVSATILTQVYGPAPGPWTLECEREYQSLRPLEPQFFEYTHDPVRRAALERDAPAAQWRAGIRRYDTLRLARLCAYLRARSPEAAIGHSILIFRLSAEEITRSTAGPLSDLVALIAKTEAGAK